MLLNQQPPTWTTTLASQPPKVVVLPSSSSLSTTIFVPASFAKRNMLLSCSLAMMMLMAISISATNAERPTAIKWPSIEQELTDELNDSQMLKAVQSSMREWERTKAQHQRLAAHNRVRRADKSVCYGDLGCFEDSGPFGYLDMLPSPPDEINTKFLFYSTKNRSDRPLIEIPYLNLTDAWTVFQTSPTTTTKTTSTTGKRRHKDTRSTWEALKTFEGLDALSVRVIVHGFGSSCPHVWIYELRTALMAVEDCVVICVDWELGANLPNYVRAAANTRLIGKQLAIFLKGLQQFKNLDLSRVHIIGFSLGAHVSGFAGAELPGISRITGLDPAGPLFESQHPKARLDSTDATFVDVIHSNGENLILGGLGSWQPMGDVDFYPNGGRVQHGCSNLFVGAVTDFIWSPAAAVEGRSLCNHRRAYKFFIDSVAPRCLFPAYPCDSYDDFLKGHCFPCDAAQQTDPEVAAKCGNMGYYADRSTGRGQLYLVTREEEPFCAHQFNIEIYSSEHDLPLRTLGRLDAVLTGDGTLNETFSITEKDDTEFFAGDTISRILVPHPALGFPHAVTLRYKSYSGWLSKGLAQWTIQKMVLTDSFGTKRSICRPDIRLQSDKLVYLELEAGECELPAEEEQEEEEQEPYTDSSNSDQTSSTTTEQSTTTVVEPTESASQRLRDYQYTTVAGGPPYDDDVDRLREKKEIIKLGSSYQISTNSTSSSSTLTREHDIDERLPWQPLLENSIDDQLISSESGRSISDDSLRSTTQRLTTRREINEPILKSTTQRITSSTTSGAAASMVEDDAKIRPRENSYFTIQLLPFRLGELIERAERYARETLLPLITEQAPRLFGFGATTPTMAAAAERLISSVSGGGQRSSRQPKYFPSLGELNAAEQPQESRRSQRRVDLPPAFSPTLTVEQPVFDYETTTVGSGGTLPTTTTNETPAMTSTARSPAADENRRSETAIGVEESRSSSSSKKNILSLLRRQPAASDRSRGQSKPTESRYYTSPLDALAGPQPVHIVLPTYKPKSPNQFPYAFETEQPLDGLTASTETIKTTTVTTVIRH